MKEDRVGPLLRRSWKVVRRLAGLCSVAKGSGAAVAKVREDGSGAGKVR